MVSSTLTGVAGCSWLTDPMRAVFGSETSSPLPASSPRMILNRVDLPMPLRPTRPTLAPGGRLTEASSRNWRPHALKVRLVIWSMGRRLSGTTKAVPGDGGRGGARGREGAVGMREGRVYKPATLNPPNRSHSHDRTHLLDHQAGRDPSQHHRQ